MTDPNYKQSLVNFFKSRGFKYKDIDAWMERNNIDNRINEAKALAYANQYQNAVGDNDYLNAGFALSRLAATDPKQASALMAMYPNYKDMFNATINRENAMMANRMRNEAADKERAFKHQEQQDKFAHDMKKLYEQGKINAMLENIRSNLRTDELRREFDFKFRQASALYGEEAAAKMVVDSMFGKRSGSSGSGNPSGGRSGSADDGIMKPSDIKTYYELAEEFDSNPENEGQFNPYREALNNNEKAIHDKANNNYIIEPSTINSSDQAYHNASTIIDWAREGRITDNDGNKPTKEGIYQLIRQYTGDFAPNIIQQYENDPKVLADFKSSRSQ